MNRIVRFALVALLAVVTFAFLSPPASATEIVWKTVQLKINGSTAAKTLATVQDTAFAELPTDIAMDWNNVATATVYPWARLTFAIGTGVANADTVRYQLISQAPGLRGYVSLVEQTAAVGNTALTHGGRVFVGTLLYGQATGANATAFPFGGATVLKLAGDPNGSITGLKAYLTYPARAAAK